MIAYQEIIEGVKTFGAEHKFNLWTRNDTKKLRQFLSSKFGEHVRLYDIGFEDSGLRMANRANEFRAVKTDLGIQEILMIPFTQHGGRQRFAIIHIMENSKQ